METTTPQKSGPLLGISRTYQWPGKAQKHHKQVAGQPAHEPATQKHQGGKEEATASKQPTGGHGVMNPKTTTNATLKKKREHDTQVTRTIQQEVYAQRMCSSNNG